jgi:hypothetical protein
LTPTKTARSTTAKPARSAERCGRTSTWVHRDQGIAHRETGVRKDVVVRTVHRRATAGDRRVDVAVDRMMMVLAIEARNAGDGVPKVGVRKAVAQKVVVPKDADVDRVGQMVLRDRRIRSGCSTASTRTKTAR